MNKTGIFSFGSNAALGGVLSRTILAQHVLTLDVYKLAGCVEKYANPCRIDE